MEKEQEERINDIEKKDINNKMKIDIATSLGVYGCLHVLGALLYIALSGKNGSENKNGDRKEKENGIKIEEWNWELKEKSEVGMVIT